jgi:uncharacterized membrane protein YvbJ
LFSDFSRRIKLEIDIMFCPECGTENMDTAVFCLDCGTRIKPNPKPSSEKTLKKIIST